MTNNTVFNEIPTLYPCPCCGFQSISSRGNYEICTICWWEDDGQDNCDAEKIQGGPNEDISLALGRFNYLIYGLYNPNRTDLVRLKADINKYQKKRIFEIVDSKYLVEKETDWQWKIPLFLLNQEK